MKSYNWKEYSEKYCENIECIEANEDKTFCFYKAFDKVVWNCMNYIVYKDKVIEEGGPNANLLSGYYSMLTILNHLKEEGELIK